MEKKLPVNLNHGQYFVKQRMKSKRRIKEEKEEKSKKKRWRGGGKEI